MVKLTKEDRLDMMRTILDNEFSVFETKNESVNQVRRQKKQQLIEYLLRELEKPPAIYGGTRADTPSSIFGDDWNALSHAVRRREDYRCYICGREQSEVHHIRPRFLGGKNTPTNLVCLCRKCHTNVHRYINRGIDLVLIMAIQDVKNLKLDRFERMAMDVAAEELADALPLMMESMEHDDGGRDEP